MANKTITLPEQELRNLYHIHNYTIQQLCKHFGVSNRTILVGFSDYNIVKRTRSETQLLDIPQRTKHNITKEILEDLYVTKNMDGTKISEMYNISTTVITKLFKRFNIPVRNKHEQQNLIHNSKIPNKLQMFIIASNITHNNKYDYSKVEYKNSHSKISIRCPIHGIFYQMAYKHQQGTGCFKCCKLQFSKSSIDWLNSIMNKDDITIQHADNVGEYKIPGTRYKADGYCVETNTVYEFHGDRWHGNPNIFGPNDKCHPFNSNITARELYNKTIVRENKIKSLGYNLIIMWEYNWSTLC